MKNEGKMSKRRIWIGIKNGLCYSSVPFLFFILLFAWRIGFFSWCGNKKFSIQQFSENDPVLRTVTTGFIFALLLSACILLFVERKRKLEIVSISVTSFLLFIFIIIRKIGNTTFLSSRKETMKNSILSFCEDHGITVFFSKVRQFIIEHQVIDIVVVILLVVFFFEGCLGFVYGFAVSSENTAGNDHEGNGRNYSTR